MLVCLRVRIAVGGLPLEEVSIALLRRRGTELEIATIIEILDALCSKPRCVGKVPSIRDAPLGILYRPVTIIVVENHLNTSLIG